MAPVVIVSGANGFIGSAVAAEFEAAGYSVAALIRESSSRARLLRLPRIKIIPYSDLRKPELQECLSGLRPSVFVHCAWAGVAGKERDSPSQVDVNVKLTIDAVDLAVECGVTHWIGLGSQAEYGPSEKRLTESSPTRPATLYGIAKLAAGISSLSVARANLVKATWLRVFSTYGPGDHDHWLIPYVVQCFLEKRAPKLTGCEQYWDFLHVSDAAAAVRAVYESGAGGVYNLGYGESRPLKSYIMAIQRQLGGDIVPDFGALPYRNDQSMRLECAIDALTAVTGWRPKVEFESGVASLIRGRTHPVVKE